MGQLRRARPGAGEPKRRVGSHYRHSLVAGMIDWWFVCLRCGLVAVCPGCVSLVPGDAPFHFCAGHEYLRAVESYSGRMVWATEDSSR